MIKFKIENRYETKQPEKEDSWRPFPMQEIALRTKAYEMLVGGARGPGKTTCGIVWLMKCIENPRFRGLVIRRNAVDLSDWIDRATEFYRAAGGKVVGKPSVFSFPSGAKIYTGHLKDVNAYENYQGHEYQRIVIEELTQIPDEGLYLKLIASCRSTVDGIDPRVFCTANPGGPGHVWVKKRFVEPSLPKKKFVDPVSGRTRVFIPGTVDDNPILKEKDPDYVKFLDSLPEQLRKAWRDGSWDALIGQYFEEFDRDLTVYNSKQFLIPTSWPRFRSVDWGYTAPLACYWHAIGPDRHLWTYREHYVTGKLDVDAATEIYNLSKGEEILYTVGDPMSFPVEIPHYKFGKMIPTRRAEVWAENGVPITMGDNSRIFGWNRMREYLTPRPYLGGEQSSWHIAAECINLIRELATAVRDDKKPEDVDTNCSDHGIDSCRLAMMSRPPLLEPTRDKPVDHIEAAERYQERKKSAQGYEAWQL